MHQGLPRAGGFALANRVEGLGGASNVTGWTCYTSGSGKGQVKTEKRQSGLFKQYAYDNADRVVSETRSGPGMMTEATTYDYTPVDPSDPVLPVDTRPRTVRQKGRAFLYKFYCICSTVEC